MTRQALRSRGDDDDHICYPVVSLYSSEAEQLSCCKYMGIVNTYS